MKPLQKATQTLVTRRMNEFLRQEKTTLPAETRETIVANLLHLANDFPDYYSPEGTPASKRIGPQELVNGLLTTHFETKEIDLTATNVEATEYLDIAKAQLEKNFKQEEKLKTRAQESRRPLHYGAGIREVETPREWKMPGGGGSGRY